MPLLRQPTRFKDRRAAGRRLADLLSAYADRDDVVVLALPRGGVPVGQEVARTLKAPLDIVNVRKLGVPGHREMAFGALCTGGVCLVDQRLVERLGLTEKAVQAVIDRERAVLDARENTLRGGAAPVAVAGQIAIVVDDGIATGATMAAAIAGLEALRPARILVAVPVASAGALRRLREQLNGATDPIHCVLTPTDFRAVGLWYDDFSPVSDAEVRGILAEAPNEPPNEFGV